MNKFVAKQSLLLFLTATIWGVAFVAQSVGTKYIGPFTFNAIRTTIGAIVLLPYIGLLHYSEQKHEYRHVRKKSNKELIIAGLLCGTLLFIASNLQQFGIMHTTAGKAGFITSMYIVLVPVLGIFLHKKMGVQLWIAVAIAVAGMYFLCGIGTDASLQKGDLLLLGCAGVFSFHILVVDHFSPRVNGVMLSCIQFLVCSILSGIGMLLSETPSISAIWEARIPILYAGVMSCGVAYTLQIIGQKGMNPSVASLILSLESVVSVLAGWLILGQKLSPRELCGCALSFTAIILVQIPSKHALTPSQRDAKRDSNHHK